MDAHRQNGRSPKASSSADRERADDDDEAHDLGQGAMTDEQLAHILSKKRIRSGACVPLMCDLPVSARGVPNAKEMCRDGRAMVHSLK